MCPDKLTCTSTNLRGSIPLSLPKLCVNLSHKNQSWWNFFLEFSSLILLLFPFPFLVVIGYYKAKLSHIMRVRIYEREPNHEIIFRNHSKLLKFSSAMIESASVKRELWAEGNGFTKDYVTKNRTTSGSSLWVPTVIQLHVSVKLHIQNQWKLKTSSSSFWCTFLITNLGQCLGELILS